MLHERNALLRQGEAVFFRPDFLFGHFEDGASVLQDEAEGRIETG